MEQQIKIAAKLYQCRDTARSMARLNGVDYKESIKEYIEIIHSVMKKENLGTIEALLFISKMDAYQEMGIVQLKFMAATVEIIEPSE